MGGGLIELPLRPRVSHGYNLEVSDQVSWVAPACSLLDRHSQTAGAAAAPQLYVEGFPPPPPLTAPPTGPHRPHR